MKVCTCDVCLRTNIRMHGMDWLVWRGEMGWEQSLNMDMEAAARMDDPS